MVPAIPAAGAAAPPAVPAVPVAPLVPTPVPTSVSTAADRASWLRRRALRFQVPPVTVAATGVAKLASARNRPVDEPMAGEGDEEGTARADRPAGGRGRAGTAVGRAVHATLQVVDMATGEGLVELARREALAEGVGHRAGEVAHLVESALGAEVVRAAVAGGRYWRELYVGVPVGERVLEGIVDLLVDGPDGLEVVDYKTDQGAEELATGYRLQGAAYAVAVESALGRPVDRCTFLFLRPGTAIVRRVDDLDEARAEVRRLLRAPDSAAEQAVS
jgi:ATP-dependent helicase/nuclease subunit A